MANYFLSPEGAGDFLGADADNAIAWAGGAGLSTWLADVAAPGDIITIALGEYFRTVSATFTTSGTEALPIIVQGAGPDSPNVARGYGPLEVSDQWPTIDVNGGTLIGLAPGVSHVKIRRLNIENGLFLSTALGGNNNNFEVSSIRGRNMVELVRTKNVGEDKPNNNWLFTNIYLKGHHKRVIHGENIHDSIFSNTFVDAYQEDGSRIEDFAIYFRFSHFSENVECIDIHGESASVIPDVNNDTGYYYTNGDIFTTEETTNDIRFTRCVAKNCGDAGFDCKGAEDKAHIFTDCHCINIGHRDYRVWDGTYIFNNCISESLHTADLGLKSRGVGIFASIWVRHGTVTVNNFKSINASRLGETGGDGTIIYNDGVYELGDHLPDRVLAGQGDGRRYTFNNPTYRRCIRVSSMSSRELLEMPGPRPLTGLSAIAAGGNVFKALGWQSNGRGHPLGTAYTGTMPTKTQVWGADGWELYTPDHHGYVTPMSPTLGMALAFEARYPDLTLYLVDVGQGGQGFQSGSGVFGPAGAIRARLVSYISGAIANLKTLSTPVYSMGFSLFQGEKDSEQVAWADAYQAQLSAFLDAMDAAAGFDMYRLITRTHVNVPIKSESAKVRAAQLALADSIIDIDGYSTLGDQLHFSPADYKLIGESYLDAFSAIALPRIEATVTGPTDPPATPTVTTVSFRDLVRMEEFETGSIRDTAPYGSGTLPKGATVDAEFKQGDYFSCVADNLGNNTSVIVIFNSADNQDYNASGGTGRLAGWNFKNTIVHTHPPMGSGDAQSLTHKGNGVVGRLAWIGDDAVVQTSDDDGATWNRTHKTFTGVMAGLSVAYIQMIQGFSGGVEKRLIDCKKGRV